MWLQDMRIIARQSAEAGAVEVIAQRHEVMLMDCRTVWMHVVMAHGAPIVDQRALMLPDGRLQLVCLEHLAPGITADLKTSSARDVPGVVLYTLRARFATLPALLARCEQVQFGAWHPEEGAGYVWQAAAKVGGRQIRKAA